MNLKMNNSNFTQVRKWAVEILLTLIAAFVIWLAYGVNQLSAEIEHVKQLDSRVLDIETWIDDWYNILRVPERDQNQDAQILEFRRRIDRLESWQDDVQSP